MSFFAGLSPFGLIQNVALILRIAPQIAIAINMKTEYDVTLFGKGVGGILLSPCAFEMTFFSAELSSKLSNKFYGKSHHFLTPCPASWDLKKIPKGTAKDGQFSLFLDPCQIRLIWLHSLFLTFYRRNSQSFCLCNLSKIMALIKYLMVFTVC